MDTTAVANEPAICIMAWAVFRYLGTAIIGILLGIILTPLFESKIHKFLSKINTALFRQTKQLGGIWTHHWHVESSRFPEVNTTTAMTLKQVGKHISARYVISNNSGDEFTYIMDGKIENNTFVSGAWYDLYNGNTYHGTFLLHIDINMNSMKGIWVGTSQDTKVKSGEWIWERDKT
ncbi:MAG: hypothetical protein KBF73_08605 [Flavobacteriales bacterium]|nr:hypothetical protein [Flavobacteriales bacterium]